MSMNAGLYSSATCEWETPRALFDELDAEFHFETDVCATAENAKCAKFWTQEQNGLVQKWRGVCWMNPPYGREIRKWVCAAYLAALDGATVVCLLPARTDTEWWHRFVIGTGAEVRFLRGRLRFSGAKWNAPFASAIVIFRPTPALPLAEHRGGQGSLFEEHIPTPTAETAAPQRKDIPTPADGGLT